MATYRYRSGKWQARVQRGGILAQKTFSTKKDAERWAREIEVEIERGTYLPPVVPSAKPQTIADLLERYEREIAGQHRSATTLVNIGTLKRTLGSLSLSALTAQVVACWRDGRLRQVKPPSVAREINTLSAILNHARKEWCISITNPIPDVKRPANGKPRVRRLEAGEEDRILVELKPTLQRIVRFAIETGMRRGEILSMHWEHIFWKQSVVWLPMTKNGEGRTVPLSPQALRVLNELRASEHCSNGKVFDVSSISVDRGWRKACSRAGISDMHFHDLRHEAISRLFERGLSVVEVSSISGHKTLAMLSRYTHLRPEDLAHKLARVTKSEQVP